MNFKRLIPNIFYADIQTGLDLFAGCLEFRVIYSETGSGKQSLYVLEKRSLKIHLIEDEEFAQKDRPEIRLETDDIEEAYNKIKASSPGLLHPSLNEIRLQPWEAKEFALLDGSGLCVIIQQWEH